MTKDKALKLALEALVEVKSWKSPTRWDGCFDKEITAIKEALSSCQCPECRLVLHASDCAVHNKPAYPKDECNCGAQPSVSVEQSTECVEPVATDWERIARVQDAKLRAMCNEAGGFEKLCEVMDKYERTTSPQRTWVGLTDAERKEIHNEWRHKVCSTAWGYEQAIEAKLKEKNT